MVTTSGAAFAVRAETQVNAPQLRRHARLGVLSVVRFVESYVGSRVGRGRRNMTGPAVGHLTGPVPSGTYGAPVRPGPVDKPATLAHYQAMADQVATERRLAELDKRREAISSGAVPRDVWFVHPARRREGERRHG